MLSTTSSRLVTSRLFAQYVAVVAHTRSEKQEPLITMPTLRFRCYRESQHPGQLFLARRFQTYSKISKRKRQSYCQHTMQLSRNARSTLQPLESANFYSTRWRTITTISLISCVGCYCATARARSRFKNASSLSSSREWKRSTIHASKSRVRNRHSA